jgi:hypothetical protein
MKPIPKTDRRVVNIFESAFTPIQSNGKPDGEVLQLNTDKPLGSGFYIYKMAPGAATVPHKHKGDLRDHDGVDYGPGDLVWLRDGTVHNSSTKNGCLIAVSALEPDF